MMSPLSAQNSFISKVRRLSAWGPTVAVQMLEIMGSFWKVDLQYDPGGEVEKLAKLFIRCH